MKKKQIYEQKIIDKINYINKYDFHTLFKNIVLNIRQTLEEDEIYEFINLHNKIVGFFQKKRIIMRRMRKKLSKVEPHLDIVIDRYINEYIDSLTNLYFFKCLYEKYPRTKKDRILNESISKALEYMQTEKSKLETLPGNSLLTRFIPENCDEFQTKLKPEKIKNIISMYFNPSQEVKSTPISPHEQLHLALQAKRGFMQNPNSSPDSSPVSSPDSSPDSTAKAAEDAILRNLLAEISAAVEAKAEEEAATVAGKAEEAEHLRANEETAAEAHD